jgi:hypothetical protein
MNRNHAHSFLRKTNIMKEREDYQDYQCVSKSALLPRITGVSEENYVESFTHYLHTVFYEYRAQRYWMYSLQS